MKQKLSLCIFSFFFGLFACNSSQTTEKKIAATAKKESPVAIPTYIPKTALEEKFMKFNCHFVAYIHHPKDPKALPLALCFKTHTEVRGIYESSACVGVTIEPDSEFESPFYGSKGHWGAEGKCSKSVLDTLLADKEKDKINSTVNPITSLQFKRHEGFKVDILRDDFSIRQQVLKISDPLQNPRVMKSKKSHSF